MHAVYYSQTDGHGDTAGDAESGSVGAGFVGWIDGRVLQHIIICVAFPGLFRRVREQHLDSSSTHAALDHQSERPTDGKVPMTMDSSVNTCG